MYVCMAITSTVAREGIYLPGKVTNPARGQLNRENEYFPVPVTVTCPCKRACHALQSTRSESRSTSARIMCALLPHRFEHRETP